MKFAQQCDVLNATELIALKIVKIVNFILCLFYHNLHNNKHILKYFKN